MIQIEWSTEGALSHTTAEFRDAKSNEVGLYSVDFVEGDASDILRHHRSSTTETPMVTGLLRRLNWYM